MSFRQRAECERDGGIGSGYTGATVTANLTHAHVQSSPFTPGAAVTAGAGAKDGPSTNFFPMSLHNAGKAREVHLAGIRVQGKDGKLADGYEQWYGDGREGQPAGLEGRALDAYNRFPGPQPSFYPKALRAALDDPRGMVFGGGHGGLGNQLWAAAGIISVALSSNRLPVLNCGSVSEPIASDSTFNTTAATVVLAWTLAPSGPARQAPGAGGHSLPWPFIHSHLTPVLRI